MATSGPPVVEERLGLVLGVVLLGGRLVELAEVHGDQPQALALQPADHLPDQAAPDGVGLAEHQGALSGHQLSLREWVGAWERARAAGTAGATARR